MTIEKMVETFLGAKEAAMLSERMLMQAERELRDAVLERANTALTELSRQPWMPVSVGAFRTKFGEYQGHYIELTMTNLRLPGGSEVPDEYFPSWPPFVAQAKDFLAAQLELPSGLRLSMAIDLRYIRNDGGNQ